jgi:hypothetical protein
MGLRQAETGKSPGAPIRSASQLCYRAGVSQAPGDLVNPSETLTDRR